MKRGCPEKRNSGAAPFAYAYGRPNEMYQQADGRQARRVEEK